MILLLNKCIPFDLFHPITENRISATNIAPTKLQKLDLS